VSEKTICSETAPAKIWLCVDDDEQSENEVFPRNGEVTWAGDKATVCAVKYIKYTDHLTALAARDETIRVLVDEVRAWRDDPELQGYESTAVRKARAAVDRAGALGESSDSPPPRPPIA